MFNFPPVLSLPLFPSLLERGALSTEALLLGRGGPAETIFDDIERDLTHIQLEGELDHSYFESLMKYICTI